MPFVQSKQLSGEVFRETDSPRDHRLEAAVALTGLQNSTSIRRPTHDAIDELLHLQNHAPPARPDVNPTRLFQTNTNSLEFPLLPRKYCSGLRDDRINEHVKVNPAYCYSTFSLIKNKWHSRHCEYDAPDVTSQQQDS